MSCYLFEYWTSDGDFDSFVIKADDYLSARNIFDAYHPDTEVFHVYVRLF